MRMEPTPPFTASPETIDGSDLMTTREIRPVVLLVDDFEDAREMYAGYLTYSGFEVIEAAKAPFVPQATLSMPSKKSTRPVSSEYSAPMTRSLRSCMDCSRMAEPCRR